VRSVLYDALEHADTPFDLTKDELSKTGVNVATPLRVSRRAVSVPSAARLQFEAGVLLALSCLVTAAAIGLGVVPAVVTLVLGVLLLTAGELRQSAASWQLSFALAPESERGRYLAVFSLGKAVDRLSGPSSSPHS
jgi:hypothetical protein